MYIISRALHAKCRRLGLTDTEVIAAAETKIRENLPTPQEDAHVILLLQTGGVFVIAHPVQSRYDRPDNGGVPVRNAVDSNQPTEDSDAGQC
jgi:hypothetical protein